MQPVILLIRVDDAPRTSIVDDVAAIFESNNVPLKLKTD